MAKKIGWLDLQHYGLVLGVLELRGGGHVLACVGRTGADGVAAVLQGLGFAPAPSSPSVFVRKDLRLDLAQVLKAFPRGERIERSLEELRLGAKRPATANAPGGTLPSPDRQGGRVVGGPVASAPPQRQRIPTAADVVAAARLLGTNRRGDEVYEDAGGRFLAVEGTITREADQSGEAFLPLFLRATSAEQLVACAEGLLKAADRRILRDAQFEAFVAVVASSRDGEPPTWAAGPEETATRVFESVLAALAKRRTSVDGTSQEAFAEAVCLAEALPFLTSQGSRRGVQIAWPLAVALDRVLAVTDSDAGLTRLAPIQSLQALLRDAAAERDPAGPHRVGFFDARSGADDLLLKAALEERAPDGRTVLWLPDREALVDMRDRLAPLYAIEGAAVIAGAVAGGTPGAADAALLVVGVRRPAASLDAPAAAHRLHEVASTSDLWAWSAEVLRARTRIAEWLRDQAVPAAEDPDGQPGNKYQVPYIAASKIRAPTTMVPRALEGATNRALQRMMADFRDADEVVGRMLGRSVVQLGRDFSPEQVDAIAMCLHAHQRGRGFLLGDQTGVGKGRPLAALAAIYAAQGFRVLYVTERVVNVGDIWRDIEGAEVKEMVTPLVINQGIDIKDEVTGATALRSAAKEELQLLWGDEEPQWPEGKDLVIATYSQFNRSPETCAKARWLRAVVDENTVLILDESQNVANSKSNIGSNFAAAEERAAAIVWGSATHVRDPRGLIPYQRLFPDSVNAEVLVAALKDNGEVLQEVITAMLAEDGVLLRREHDLSTMEFRVRLPSEETEARNRHLTEELAPVLAAMVSIAGDAHRHVTERNQEIERGWLRRGVDPRVARRRTKSAGLTSASVSSPLYNLTRAFTSILKIDDALQSAREALANDQKPIILLESTFGALFDDLARDEQGLRLSDEDLATLPDIDFRSHLRRALRQLFVVRDGRDRRIDLRQEGENFARVYDEVDRMIAALPELPASPIDVVIDELTRDGWKVGEVTGRSLACRQRRVVRRPKPKATDVIKGFNSGAVDVLVVNVAGCTGVSMHAGSTFADRRKRRLIELQAPADPLKQIQGYGRVNRYDQVERPLIETLTTGLAAEMRLLAIRNQKLRRLSANVQSNREHPLLLREIPDVLNRVGDRVCQRYLAMRPELARMLGIGETVDLTNTFREDLEEMSGEPELMQNTANQMLSRCIILPVAEQERVIAEVTAEFEATVEELDSRGINPLRARELDGTITVESRAIYQGAEAQEEERLGQSAFGGPVYVLTGPRTAREQAADGQAVMSLVEDSIGRGEGDGFARCAERLRVLRASYLRPYLGIGESLDAALRNPQGVFATKLAQLEALVDVLTQIRPGAMILMTNEIDEVEARIVTSTPMPNERLQLLPAGYSVQAIAPGEAKPASINLGRIMGDKNFRIGEGLQGADYRLIQRDFDEQSRLIRQIPAQVLTGNLLEASQLAVRHKLGTLSLFRDAEGQMHRGVVTNPLKVNLELLPADVPSARCAVDLLRGEVGGRGAGKAWHGDEDEPLFLFRRLQEGGVERLQCVLPSPRNIKFAEMVGAARVYELADLLLDPTRAAEIRSQTRPRSINVVCDLAEDKVTELFHRLDSMKIALRVAGRHRELVNGWSAGRPRERAAAPDMGAVA